MAFSSFFKNIILFVLFFVYTQLCSRFTSGSLLWAHSYSCLGNHIWFQGLNWCQLWTEQELNPRHFSSLLLCSFSCFIFLEFSLLNFLLFFPSFWKTLYKGNQYSILLRRDCILNQLDRPLLNHFLLLLPFWGNLYLLPFLKKDIFYFNISFISHLIL